MLSNILLTVISLDAYFNRHHHHADRLCCTSRSEFCKNKKTLGISHIVISLSLYGSSLECCFTVYCTNRKITTPTTISSMKKIIKVSSTSHTFSSSRQHLIAHTILLTNKVYVYK